MRISDLLGYGILALGVAGLVFGVEVVNRAFMEWTGVWDWEFMRAVRGVFAIGSFIHIFMFVAHLTVSTIWPLMLLIVPLLYLRERLKDQEYTAQKEAERAARQAELDADKEDN